MYKNRKVLRSGLQRIQCTPYSRAPNSYFEMVLMKCGADLDQFENYVLSCEVITFVNNFQSLLKNHPDFPENIKIFTEGLSKALGNHNTEIKILSGCIIKLPLMETSYQSQDSMMMSFLKIYFLQKDIVKVLLERIEFYTTNSESNQSDFHSLSLLLSQLKCVSSIYKDLLYDKILKIYTNATILGQQIIIANAEFVFDPKKHDDFVLFLLDTESVDDLLNSNNVRTFSNLYLSSEIQTKLRKKIVFYINKGCAISRLPSLIQFVLKEIDIRNNDLREVVIDVRSCLSWNDSTVTQKVQLDIFTFIKQSLIRSEKLFDIWRKFLKTLKYNEIRPIDLIMSLILIVVREDKIVSLVNLIRRQIILKGVKASILYDIQTKYVHFIELYEDLLLYILHKFIEDKSPIVYDFAKKSYNIVFDIGNSSKKKKNLNKLVDLVCNKSSKISIIAIEILKNLNINFTNDIEHYDILLLPILEHINNMNLKQCRNLMQLSSLEDSPSLKKHIDMLVKKHICNSRTLTKKKESSGTIQLMDYIIQTEDQQNKLSDLPQSTGKVHYTIIFFNAQSIVTKFEKCKEVINKENPDIIALNETWIYDYEVEKYQINNYTSYFSCTEKRFRQKGTAVYIKNTIPSQLLGSKTNFLNCLQIKLPEFDLIVMYNWLRYHQHVLDFLQDIFNLEAKCLILGDMNIDILVENFHSCTYKKLISANKYIIANKIGDFHITRPETHTILDHVISNVNFNIETQILHNQSRMLDLDHNILKIKLRKLEKTKKTKKAITIDIEHNYAKSKNILDGLFSDSENSED